MSNLPIVSTEGVGKQFVSRHPDSRGSYPRLSEAEWRDLIFVEYMNRSLRFASLRSASVGMTGRR
jgi:hypothetical protein